MQSPYTSSRRALMTGLLLITTLCFSGLARADLAPEIEVFSGLTPLDAGISILAFNAVSVASSSGSTRSVLVKNNGSTELSGLVVTFDGPQGGDFKADSLAILAHAPLGVGATWSFTLSFNPSATGLRDATMHIASNDANEDPFDVSLLGFGNAPAASGTPYGWGYNSHGETGDGNAGANHNEAVPVVSTGALVGKTITKIAAGVYHTLAVASDGKLYAWGYNGYGQLGDDSTASSDEPVAVKMLSGALEGKTIIALAAGEHHSLALTSEGKVFAWGYNAYGQLGREANNTTDSDVPVQIGGSLAGIKVTAIGAGFYHSLAATTNGVVHVWGYNLYGQLGNGNTAIAYIPEALDMGWLAGGHTVIALDGGQYHSLVLTSAGQMYAWGDNSWGELGRGINNTSYSYTPVPVDLSEVPGGQTVKAISTCWTHNLALTTGGRVLAWGNNAYAASGFPSGDRHIPNLIGGNLAGGGVVEIGTGKISSLVRTDAGQVFGWGMNSFLELCGAVAGNHPMPINTSPNLTGKFITRLAVGGHHSIVLAGLPAPEIEIAEAVFDTSTPLTHAQSMTFAATPVQGNFLINPVIHITVTNSGITTLSGLSATVTGSHAADFVAGTLPLSLEPEESASITVVFNPTAVGTRNAELHIASDDADEGGFYVNLTGAAFDGSTGERVDTFAPDVSGGAVLDTVVQPDGKIIMVGSFTTVGGAGHASIARLNADGSLDTAFQAGADNSVLAVVLQADGKIIIGGYFNSLTSTNGVFPREHLARLNSDGSVDLTWYPSVDSYVHTLAIESGNTLLAGGIFSYANVTTLAPRLARFNLADTGAVHVNFVPGSGGSVHEIVLHDGKILVGGYFTSMGGVSRSNLARLNADGTADSSFIGIGCNDAVRTIAVQPSDGKIIIGGFFTNVDSYTAYRIARLHPNGTFDGSFSGALPNPVHAILVQADGRIVIGGDFEEVWAGRYWVQWPRLARLNANGKLDQTFPAAAYSDFVLTLEAEPDGDLLVGGRFDFLNGLPRRNFGRIARAVPDILVLSATNVTHTNGGTHDDGTVNVPNTALPVVYTIQNVGAAPLTGFAGGGITIDGVGASSFSILPPVATSLASGESASFSVSFLPLTPGSYEAALHIHSNDPDEEPFNLTLKGTGGLPIATWREQNFSLAQIASGDGTDNADPDHDGISNLMEFATASNPMNSSAAQESITSLGGGVLEFFYTRNKLSMAELTFQVQWSDDLLIIWSAIGVTETILSDNGLVQQVKATVPRGALDHRFVRLKVTR